MVHGSSPDESAAIAWRILENEWSDSNEQWHDSTSEFFARYYWEPLAFEMAGYLGMLESLQEILHSAQDASEP